MAGKNLGFDAMSAITQISLENIRCFGKRQAVALPRITVLVGENSTGKSTFLACCQTLAELARNDRDSYMPFNRPPFRLGDFERVARDGCREFELGGHVGDLKMWVRFAKARGHRAIREVGGPSGALGPGKTADAENFGMTERGGRISAGGLGALEFTRRGDSWRMKGPSFGLSLAVSRLPHREFTRWLGKAIRAGEFPEWGDTGQAKGVKNGEFAGLCSHLARLSVALNETVPDVRAVSPAFPLPQDSYGRHPLFPAQRATGKRVEAMMRRVRAAGKALGLFSGIRVRERGSEHVLEVKADGCWRNISDVGLGVHRAVRTLAVMAESPTGTVLMQQPERQLHPQAEAALGQLVAESRGRFVVETHSDFILDRLRVCVRKGVISPEDLGILWLEKRAGRTRIHRVAVDDRGKVADPPRGYRRFFGEETLRVLGFDEDEEDE